ncbi:MAG: phosphatidate cytidylyltransferase [Gemmatimonadota bacterium]|jgi:phosphatidate cytidylyltransferase
MARSGGNLARRLAVAAVGIPIVLLVAWLGEVLLAIGLGVLAVVAVRELGRMLAVTERPFLWRLAPAAAAALPTVAWTVGWGGFSLFVASTLIVMLGVATLRIPPDRGPFEATALSFTSVLYVGGLLSFALLLRETLVEDRAFGFALFLLPVVITWVADSAAYFAGRAFGKRPMAPIVSPNKTVEGGIAGLLAGPVAALLMAYAAVPQLAALGPLRLGITGLLVAAAAILGDLAESALKRECGVKDSSNLLPGHGGLLDRMDSLLFAFPVAYLCLALWLR